MDDTRYEFKFISLPTYYTRFNEWILSFLYFCARLEYTYISRETNKISITYGYSFKYTWQYILEHLPEKEKKKIISKNIGGWEMCLFGIPNVVICNINPTIPIHEGIEQSVVFDFALGVLIKII